MSGVAPIGDFSGHKFIKSGRFSSTLQRFLRDDNLGVVLCATHSITSNGLLKLGVKLGNGEAMRPICGLREYPQLYLQISEERLENGDGIKILLLF